MCSNSFFSLYAHLSRIDVRVGQNVSQGQSLGGVGATGWASTNGLNVSATTGAAFMTLNGTDWANGVTNPVASTYTADTFTASTNDPASATPCPAISSAVP